MGMKYLKTLKELENVKNDTLTHLIKEFKEGKVNKNIVTSTYFLRYEAIKWIKSLRSKHNYPNKIPADVMNTTNWIKHFFNILEDEIGE